MCVEYSISGTNICPCPAPCTLYSVPCTFSSRVIGSELVQKYVGEGARMVRELFEMARTKKACLIFFDEIDAVGGARFDDGAGGDNEVQRTMLELINQLDGFDPRGNIKVRALIVSSLTIQWFLVISR